MDIQQLLKLTIDNKASDLHLLVGILRIRKKDFLPTKNWIFHLAMGVWGEMVEDLGQTPITREVISPLPLDI